MPEWELHTRYDHRFAAIAIQAQNNGAVSPVYHVEIKELLKQMPRHEALACLQMSEDASLPPSMDIETYRRAAIREAGVTGKVVLDIGGYDGWAAKLALDCGAARAICLDNHQYEHYGWAEKKLEGVEYVCGDMMGESECVSPYVDYIRYPSGAYWAVPFDVLINYNVLYHTKNPWAFLDRCRKVIKPDGTMLLCTLFRYHDGPWAYLYDPRECNVEDETVYWGFSLQALERLLKHTGWDFEQSGLAYDRVVYTCKPKLNFERSHEDT